MSTNGNNALPPSAPALPPAQTSAAFDSSRVTDEAFGINAGTIQAGDIHAQRGGYHFHNSTVYFHPPDSSESTRTPTTNEQLPQQSTTAPALEPAVPEVIETGYQQEEQTEAGKHATKEQGISKRKAGGTRRSNRKCVLITVVVGFVTIALGVGLGVGLGLSKKSENQDPATTSSSSPVARTRSTTTTFSGASNATVATATTTTQFTSSVESVDISMSVPVYSSTTTRAVQTAATTQSSSVATSTTSPAIIPNTLSTFASRATTTISGLTSSTRIPSNTITTAPTAAPTPACTCGTVWGGCPGASCSDNNGCCDGPTVCLYSTCHYVSTSVSSECIYGIAGAACVQGGCCPGYHCDTSKSQCVLA